MVRGGPGGIVFNFIYFFISKKIATTGTNIASIISKMNFLGRGTDPKKFPEGFTVFN